MQVVFEPARAEDDGAIRALLRATPLAGKVRLSLERGPAPEPSASRAHTFVLRAPGNGRVLGLARRSVWPVWLGGEVRALGYLSWLRRAPELALTRSVLRAGFEACERTRRPEELAFDLTSILEENRTARRLLERGLSFLPSYQPLFRFLTLTLDVQRALRRTRSSRDAAGTIAIRSARPDEGEAVLAFLRSSLARHPFASVWTKADLDAAGLPVEDFVLAEHGGRSVGALALWDQRAFKQTVVRGYSRGVAWARPILNPLAALAGRPRLPAVGTVLPMAFLSHLALEAGAEPVFPALLRHALERARTRGIRYAVVGLAEEDSLVSFVRRLGPHELASVLYRVVPAGGVPHEAGFPGVPRPEVALL